MSPSPTYRQRGWGGGGGSRSQSAPHKHIVVCICSSVPQFESDKHNRTDISFCCLRGDLFPYCWPILSTLLCLHATIQNKHSQAFPSYLLRA